MDCVCCGYVIPDSEQRYNLSDVCTDIVNIIERQVGHEIDVEAILCQECFENSIEALQGSYNNVNTESLVETPNTNDPIVKTIQSKENDSGIEALESDENNSVIESLQSKENDSIIENVSSKDDYSTRTLGANENDFVLDSQEANENDSVLDSQEANENDSVLDSQEANESDSFLESLDANETDSVVESQAAHENNFVLEAPDTNEINSIAESLEDCENDSVLETLESKDSDSDIEIVEFIPSCVWCQTSLDKKLCYSLRDGPQRNAIFLRISPREIPPDAQVCSSCWLRACRVVETNKDIESNIMDVCILCKNSLKYRRSHFIPDGPERKKIALRITPQKLYACSKICHICWISNKIKLVNGTPNPKDPGKCVVCSTSLIRKLTHLLPQGCHRKVILKKIYPRQVTANSLLCQECWLSTLNSIPHRQVQTSLELYSYKKTTDATNCCFIPGCKNGGWRKVPEQLTFNLLSVFKLFVPGQARVCTEHKNTENWKYIIDGKEFCNDFNGNEIENMLTLLSSSDC